MNGKRSYRSRGAAVARGDGDGTGGAFSGAGRSAAQRSGSGIEHQPSGIAGDRKLYGSAALTYCGLERVRASRLDAGGGCSGERQLETGGRRRRRRGTIRASAVRRAVGPAPASRQIAGGEQYCAANCGLRLLDSVKHARITVCGPSLRNCRQLGTSLTYLRHLGPLSGESAARADRRRLR